MSKPASKGDKEIDICFVCMEDPGLVKCVLCDTPYCAVCYVATLANGTQGYMCCNPQCKKTPEIMARYNKQRKRVENTFRHAHSEVNKPTGVRVTRSSAKVPGEKSVDELLAYYHARTVIRESATQADSARKCPDCPYHFPATINNKAAKDSLKKFMDGRTSMISFTQCPCCPTTSCDICGASSTSHKQYVGERAGVRESDYCRQQLERLKKAQEVEKAERLLAEAKAAAPIACPKCKIGVEKSEGCNHMTCWAQCGQHFCYTCGKALTLDGVYAHFAANNPTGCKQFDDTHSDDDNAPPAWDPPPIPLWAPLPVALHDFDNDVARLVNRQADLDLQEAIAASMQQPVYPHTAEEEYAQLAAALRASARASRLMQYVYSSDEEAEVQVVQRRHRSKSPAHPGSYSPRPKGRASRDDSPSPERHTSSSSSSSFSSYSSSSSSSSSSGTHSSSSSYMSYSSSSSSSSSSR
jgi:hypothetical protein